ncbi:MAG TPA: Ig-like domain-containing protein, partial [Longimicrobium sp.]|nr:Ig-like domain-containing protein [Longimicrobium sp.]
SVFDMVGRGISDDVTWSSSDPAVVTVAETSDSTAQIQGVAQGTAWIKAESQANSVRKDSVLVTVNNAPVLNLDSISAVSNVTMPVDSAHGMLANDGSDEKLTVSAGAVSTDRGGTATISANGSFTYLSKSGYSGLDTIRYTVTDGSRTLPGKAVVRVEDSRYWYVKAGATGDGRDSSPFGTLAAAQDSAAAGDTILVLANGVQQVNGAVTLEANQAIIGQGTSEPITRGTYNGAAITVLASGAAPGLTNTAAGATVTLATNNVVRGVGITAADGAAIAGTGFGTLFVRESGVNPAGPALLLSTGALDAVFATFSSTGSTTTGVSLTNVTGSLTGTAGAISGSVGTAFHVSGGSADITYGGSITNASGLAASISGRTGGALAVSGDVTDSAGGISVTGISGGAVGFSGALSLTGSGVSVETNTGGTVSFTGTSKTINTGTNPGVSLTNNTGAAVQFGGGGLAVSTTSGAGFTATGGGTVTVTGAGNTVASTTGTALTLGAVGTDASGVNFVSVSANGAPNGIVLSSVTGAGLQVTGVGATAGSGGTVQNTTGHAISLASMTGADSVNLKFMSVGGGNAGTAGIFGSGFGTLRVTGVSVATTGGPALSLATGTLNGGFSSLGSANSASNGVILTSTGGSFTASAGSITGAASTAFAVASGAVSAAIAGSISQANAAPVVAVSGGHNGALTFETGTVGATNGTGLQFNDADGTYAFNGTTTLNGGDAAVDITNSSTGTFTFGTGASVTSPTGSAFTVYGSSPTVAYNGNLTKGN